MTTATINAIPPSVQFTLECKQADQWCRGLGEAQLYQMWNQWRLNKNTLHRHKMFNYEQFKMSFTLKRAFWLAQGGPMV
jgi:hypothetical protein